MLFFSLLCIGFCISVYICSNRVCPYGCTLHELHVGVIFGSRPVCPICIFVLWFWSFSHMQPCLQASRARLFKEYKEVQREKVADPDIQLVCDDSNIFKWTALIKVSLVIDEEKHGVLCCCLIDLP